MKGISCVFLFLVMILSASPMSAQCGYWTGPCPNPNPWQVPPPPAPKIQCGQMPDGRIVCFCDGCNSVMQSAEQSPFDSPFIPPDPSCTDDQTSDKSGSGCHDNLTSLSSSSSSSSIEVNFKGKETRKEDGYYIKHGFGWTNDEHPRRYC